MGILAGIRHWFDKRSSVLTVAETTLEQLAKFNALVRSDPEDIILICDGRITGEVMARETSQEEILTLATQFENKFAEA